MNYIIRWLITIPFAAIIIAFAIYNRHEINIYINPFGSDPLIIDTYIFTAMSALIGIIWGSIMAWLSYSTKRQKIKEQKTTINILKKEIKIANQNNPTINSKLRLEKK